MGCFSLEWIEQLLIWLVVIIAIVAIIRLVLPYLLSLFGPQPAGGGIVFRIISIVLWAVVAIFCIYIAFDLIACLISSGGPHLLSHRY